MTKNTFYRKKYQILTSASKAFCVKKRIPSAFKISAWQKQSKIIPKLKVL